jgi:hypothetical protein
MEQTLCTSTFAKPTNMNHGSNIPLVVCACDNFRLDGVLGLVCSTCHSVPIPSQVVDAQVRREARVTAANKERDQVHDQYNMALAQLEVALATISQRNATISQRNATISQLCDATISQRHMYYQDAVRAYENAAADRDRVMDQRDAVMIKLAAANVRVQYLEQSMRLLLGMHSPSILDSS